MPREELELPPDRELRLVDEVEIIHPRLNLALLLLPAFDPDSDRQARATGSHIFSLSMLVTFSPTVSPAISRPTRKGKLLYPATTTS